VEVADHSPSLIVTPKGVKVLVFNGFLEGNWGFWAFF
jgi:hypothetical protein